MGNSYVLIDTDIAINYIRYGLSKGVGAKQLYGANISRITFIELLYGYYKSKNNREFRRIEDFFTEFNINVIEIDKNISHKFCELKVRLEKKGKVIPDFDLLIASTAITNNLKLYTNNIAHFSRILDLEIFK